MRFALVSDVHFGPAASFGGKLRKLSHRAEELLGATLDRLRSEFQPELLVNLGDVIEDESPELDRARITRFVDMTRSLGVPVLHVAGNHDTIGVTAAELAELWGAPGNTHYSRDIGGVHFAVLHTLEERDVKVTLPEEQLAWLRNDLAAARAPAIVLMHHPASDMRLEGNRWFERAPHICRVAGRRALREAIEASGKVVAVFNGHVHWNHCDVIRGIPYVTVQSLIENLDEDAPGRPAAAFAVCDVDERRLLVTVHGAETLRYQFERT